MIRNYNNQYILIISISLLLCSLSCNSSQTIIVPENGYKWPSQERPYWPTDSWIKSPMTDHNIDPIKMELANQFAHNDQYTRALLVIKDGYLVYENYYGDGGVDQSTNLWSVTKSFGSALVGILMDKNTIRSTDQLMADLMPAYPEFDAITLHHV